MTRLERVSTGLMTEAIRVGTRQRQREFSMFLNLDEAFGVIGQLADIALRRLLDSEGLELDRVLQQPARITKRSVPVLVSVAKHELTARSFSVHLLGEVRLLRQRISIWNVVTPWLLKHLVAKRLELKHIFCLDCTRNIVCHFLRHSSSNVIHRVTYFCLCKNHNSETGSRIKNKLPEPQDRCMTGRRYLWVSKVFLCSQ